MFTTINHSLANRITTIFAIVLVLALAAPTTGQQMPPTTIPDAASLRISPAHPAANATDEAAPLNRRAITISGIAQRPDGTPIDNAVIVSSAGGKAVSNPDGSFTLAVDVPEPAESLGVTAVATIDSVIYTANRLMDFSPGDRRRDLGAMPLSAGGNCEPQWLPTFGGPTGLNHLVLAMTVFDDGSEQGPALYVGGYFTTADGKTVNHIAKWDGTTWSALDGGVNDHVWALTVFDDGSGGGPALYVGGRFTTAGGVSANQIAKWDGTAWSALGDGVGGAFSPLVAALTVFDDGSGDGKALYAGGVFSTAGSVQVNSIAKWDGAAWSNLGTGMTGAGTTPWVADLIVFDDQSGAGPALYAGGNFVQAGGVDANSIAKWDGSTWSALSTGVGGQFPHVYALAVFDDGSGAGPALYAGGWFTSAGDVPNTYRIARWDGADWFALGSGISDGEVRALAVFTDESGVNPSMYVGGFFSSAGGVPVNHIAKWDGATWSDLGSGMDSGVYAMSTFDDGLGDGPALYTGGLFTTVSDAPANYIAKWNGTAWSDLGDGVNEGMNSTVRAIIEFDEGRGGTPAVYAGGSFSWAGGESVNRIAKWDGAAWSDVGGGMDGFVSALAAFDDGKGTGPELYAGGRFTTAGNVPATCVARWNGVEWAPLGSGVGGVGFPWVYALTVFDDGSGGGPALYAGGNFTTAGGVEVNHIGKWDGTKWSSLGSGLGGHGANTRVEALTVFDDGSGSGTALYVGGYFTTAGGVSANGIAKWDGSQWSPLGSGMNSSVSALAAFDDGSGDGAALYAGGVFLSAGGVSGTSRIARWNGMEWSSVGGGMNERVSALEVFDDGLGARPALFAGGRFTLAGNVPAKYIARWDGTTWSNVGSGMNDWVLALTAFENDAVGGRTLYAGGRFTISGSERANHIAKWGCPPQPKCAPADLNCDGVVNVSDLLILFDNWGACSDCDDCPADLNDDCVVNVADLLILFDNWG